MMMMTEIRRLRFAIAPLGLAIALTAACGDPTGGLSDFLGQLRVRPVFSTGSAPDELGVSLDSMAVELRNEISGELRVDTVVAYEDGGDLSWILELESDSDFVMVRLSLLSLTDTLYVGDRELVIREGTIGAAPLEDVEVLFMGASAERVEVTPEQAVLEMPGSTLQFEAVVYDGDGDPIGGRTFNWTSSAPGVATVDDTGQATGVGNGTALIIASVAGVADTATVTVYAITSIVVQPQQMTLNAIGSTGQATATAYDANGNPISGVAFGWTTSDAAVASVDASGLVTAVGGGTAEIVAMAGGKADTALVTVTQSIERVEVTPSRTTMTALDATVQLEAAAFDGNGNVIPGASFTWTTSDVDVAMVDGTGLVSATGQGTVSVVATAGGRADTALVTVTQEVDRVEVTPAQVTLKALGATSRLTASAYDANGHAIPGASFAWTTSAAGVATVDASGLVTGVGNGTAGIVATTAGVADTAAVIVAQQVDRVDVTPADTMLLGAGATAQLSATAFDARSNPIAGATFGWSSTDAAVASVDASGLVTAVDAGTARVIAASDGHADTTAITVAVRDSITYPIDRIEIGIGDGPSESSLGVFDVPAHVASLGVDVSAEVELSFNEEVDEAFAIAIQEVAGPRFLSGAGCPVVPDDPSLGTGWLPVANADLPAGAQEFVARHGTLFACYAPNGGLEGPQSVLFVGIRFVYWRTS